MELEKCLLSPSRCPVPRYLSTTYEKYRPLLDGSASLDVDTFLKSDEELSMFGKVRTPSLKHHV